MCSLAIVFLSPNAHVCPPHPIDWNVSILLLFYRFHAEAIRFVGEANVHTARRAAHSQSFNNSEAELRDTHKKWEKTKEIKTKTTKHVRQRHQSPPTPPPPSSSSSSRTHPISSVEGNREILSEHWTVSAVGECVDKALIRYYVNRNRTNIRRATLMPWYAVWRFVCVCAPDAIAYEYRVHFHSFPARCL